MQILAHRGSPTGAVPENTVAAVALALAGGADGVEVDLRLSADDELVVCHDPDLSRLTGVPLEIATTGWADLRAGAAGVGLDLACVEQLLAVAHGTHVVLELKQPPTPGAVQRTAQVLAERLEPLAPLADGGQLDVTISSFSPALASAARQALPPALAVRTALLGRPTTRLSALLRQALAAGHDEVHPHVAAVLTEPGCVALAHSTGLAVVPWTVNRARTVRRLERLGVDALITDVPVVARLALASHRQAA